MATGGAFIESIQRACQCQENNRMGLGADKKEWIKTDDILQRLEKPSDDRAYRIKDAFRLGVPVSTVHRLTRIDPWYLKEIQKLISLEQKLNQYNVPVDIDKPFMKKLKQHGYSDAQIAWLMRVDEEEVRRHRKCLGVSSTYKACESSVGDSEA